MSTEQALQTAFVENKAVFHKKSLSKYLKRRQIDSSEAVSLDLLRNISREHTILVNNIWFKTSLLEVSEWE